MYYVYVIYSDKFHRTYTGLTSNLDKRLKEHNSGATRSIRPYLPYRLIYQEIVDSLEKARAREKYLKTCAGKKFLKSQIFLPYEIITKSKEVYIFKFSLRKIPVMSSICTKTNNSNTGGII
jgi:putative endonuclease